MNTIKITSIIVIVIFLFYAKTYDELQSLAIAFAILNILLIIAGNFEGEKNNEKNNFEQNKKNRFSKKSKRYYFLDEFIYKKNTDEKFELFDRNEEDGEITLKLIDPNMHHWTSNLYDEDIEIIKYRNNKAIISCPECSKECSIPIAEVLEVTCPQCDSKWVQRTDLRMKK